MTDYSTNTDTELKRCSNCLRQASQYNKVRPNLIKGLILNICTECRKELNQPITSNGEDKQ